MIVDISNGISSGKNSVLEAYFSAPCSYAKIEQNNNMTPGYNFKKLKKKEI